jgi:hypothetical protein
MGTASGLGGVWAGLSKELTTGAFRKYKGVWHESQERLKKARDNARNRREAGRLS